MDARGFVQAKIFFHMAKSKHLGFSPLRRAHVKLPLEKFREKLLELAKSSVSSLVSMFVRGGLPLQGLQPSSMYRLTHFAFIAAIFMGSLISVLAQGAERPALPMPEAYFPVLAQLLDTAGKQSSRMISRNADDAIAAANRMLARAGQLPGIGGSAQYNPWQIDVRGDVPDPIVSQRFTYNFSLIQSVYHWGAMRNNTRIGDLQVKISQGQTAEAYRLLEQEIRGQFFQLILRKVSLARARFARELADAKVKQAEEQLAAHTIADGDMFGIRMGLTQAILAFDRAQEDYEAVGLLLSKLTGAAPLRDDQIPDAIPVVAPDTPELEAMFAHYTGAKVESSNNLKVIGDQIRIEELSYKIASVRLRPKFNFVTGVSQDLQSFTTNISQKYSVRSYYVGAQVNWSIFDGFSTRAMKISSLARRRQLEQSYKTMTTDLIDQARSQLKQLGFAARSMAISDQYLVFGEESVKEKKADVLRGTGAQADVNNAALSLFDSRINAYAVRIDYLMRAAEYLSVVGDNEPAATFTTPHRS